VPQRCGRDPECETVDAPGLGRADLVHRRAPGDGEHLSVEVVELERGELAASGTGIRSESDCEQVLLGGVHPLLGTEPAVVVGSGLLEAFLGSAQQEPDRVGRQVPSRFPA
jgi:hypothetical protein